MMLLYPSLLESEKIYVIANSLLLGCSHLSCVCVCVCVCVCAHAHAQSCLTLCDLMVCSLSGSSVHGIFQARILEWVAIPIPRLFPTQGLNPCFSCLLHWQADSLLLCYLGSPTSLVSSHK